MMHSISHNPFAIFLIGAIIGFGFGFIWGYTVADFENEAEKREEAKQK